MQRCEGQFKMLYMLKIHDFLGHGSCTIWFALTSLKSYFLRYCVGFYVILKHIRGDYSFFLGVIYIIDLDSFTIIG